MVSITCQLCGTVKQIPESWTRKAPSKFCSTRCKAIWQMTHPGKGPTKIEERMRVFLDMLGVRYEAQRPFPGVGIVDFYVPEQSLAIEVDGTYWHSRRETQQSDRRKDVALAARGIQVLRVPGVDLGESPLRSPQREMRLTAEH